MFTVMKKYRCNDRTGTGGGLLEDGSAGWGQWWSVRVDSPVYSHYPTRSVHWPGTRSAGSPWRKEQELILEESLIFCFGHLRLSR